MNEGLPLGLTPTTKFTSETKVEYSLVGEIKRHWLRTSLNKALGISLSRDPNVLVLPRRAISLQADGG